MNIPSVRRPVWLVGLMVLALVQLACNYATQMVSAPTSQPGTPAPASCANKYLPAKNGATRIFVGASGYTEQVTLSNLGASSFDEDWQTNPVSGQKSLFTYYWKCTSAGLFLAGTNNDTFVFQSGVVVPVSFKAGDQWTNNYGDLYSIFTDSYKAIGEESITVPAGTFTAMKIQVSSVSQGKSSGSVTGKTDGFEWWAAGIGRIKSAYTHTAKTTTTQIDRELQSYSNP